ncbi:imidazole glycerol phosphate synthase subunit HisH [Legionella dresdenensis]|uniref:Imidazole glycerol phosphate synthase subunit HisH n=1 Tax=Legionella dresdenensis TaxID=450200 RepID=A0ABV8CBA5_9GAMM
MSSYIAIIDSGGANLTSLIMAIERLGAAAIVTDDRDTIMNAGQVILPGVGAAGFAMQRLAEKKLTVLIPELRQPVLGICLGMQLLCAHSEEGNTDCLGIIPLQVKKIQQAPFVPHMGWNTLLLTESASESILSAITTGDNFYFVHSYAVQAEARYTLATASHGEMFAACIRYRNFYGVQFHPEKSGQSGARLLASFLGSGRSSL